MRVTFHALLLCLLSMAGCTLIFGDANRVDQTRSVEGTNRVLELNLIP